MPGSIKARQRRSRDPQWRSGGRGNADGGEGAGTSPALPAVGAQPGRANARTSTAKIDYRYWPVLAIVSMDRPASVPLVPVMSVRM